MPNSELKEGEEDSTCGHCWTMSFVQTLDFVNLVEFERLKCKGEMLD